MSFSRVVILAPVCISHLYYTWFSCNSEGKVFLIDTMMA